MKYKDENKVVRTKNTILLMHKLMLSTNILLNEYNI